MAKVRIIGSYQPERTPLHGVDARAKIAFLPLAGIAVIAAHSWIGFAVCLAALAIAMLLAGVRPMQLAAAVRPCGILIGILAVLCALIPPSWAGILRGISLAVRIIIFTGFVLVVNATTTPTQLIDAYNLLLAPLARLVPDATGAAPALTWLTRLIPLVVDENARITAAQAVRGRQSPFSVATALAQVFSARGDAAAAMARRGYAGAAAHRMRVADWLIVVAGVAMIVLSVIL